MLSFQYFVNNSTNDIVKLFIKGTIIFYLLDIILFLLIGIIESSGKDIVNVLFLVFWFGLTIILYSKIDLKSINFVYYTLLLLILAVIEESIIYFNGGGLSGGATSLAQDLILAVPVFVILGVSLFLLKDKFLLTASDFYIYGSIFGLFIEIILGGKIAFVFLFGGPALFIYGSMLATFAPKTINTAKENQINLYRKILFILIVMFLFMLTGAIIGDTVYKMIENM